MKSLMPMGCLLFRFLFHNNNQARDRRRQRVEFLSDLEEQDERDSRRDAHPGDPVADVVEPALPIRLLVHAPPPLFSLPFSAASCALSAFTTACVVVKLSHIPLFRVPSAQWKKKLNLKGGKDGKEQSRERAIETFPVFAGRFNLKKHHNRAEAALLAIYASTLPTIRNQQ